MSVHKGVSGTGMPQLSGQCGALHRGVFSPNLGRLLEIGTVSTPLRTMFAAAALGWAMLSAPVTATAFTFQDGSGNSMANFDIEDQVRQFRTKPELDLSTGQQQGLKTPYGSLQFGVERNAVPYGGISNANRDHYERMFTPNYIQGRGN